MFEKRKDNARPVPAQAEQGTSAAPQPQPTPPAQPPAGSAVVGSGLVINGELSGDEDLVVAGRFEGKISLPKNALVVAKGGQVEANVAANAVQIEGRMSGDIQGGDKVVITATGQMEGKIVAPRVILVDGAKFKGSIDMDPPAAAKQPAPQAARTAPTEVRKPAQASSGQTAGHA